MRRIGLLGGTFDPPHLGHLWLGEQAFEGLNLDEVWFLPVGDPPHKSGKRITAVFHRIQMTQLSIQDSPHFVLNRADCDRPPPHNTHSLLQILKTSHPNAIFWMLMGADSLRDFTTWMAPQKIVEACRLGVLNRPDVAIDWQLLETAVPHIRQKIDWLDGPTLNLSSTAIRHWLLKGKSARFLVKTAVLDYIKTHNLYYRS